MKINRKIRQVRPADLVIDHRVQQQLRPGRVDKIAANFDADLLGTIIVSQRANGELVVLDGQHRTAGAVAAGHKGSLTAIIYTGLSLEDEARHFLGHNTKGTPRTLDKLRVKVTAGDEAAKEIATTLKYYGFTIFDDVDMRRVHAAGSLEKVYRLGGRSLLAETFAVIERAWPSDDQAGNGVLIIALGSFLHRFPDVEHDRLARLLSADRPMTFVSDVKQMKSIERLRNLDESGIRVLMNTYNKGLRTTRRLRLIEGGAA